MIFAELESWERWLFILVIWAFCICGVIMAIHSIRQLEREVERTREYEKQILEREQWIREFLKEQERLR